MYLGILIFFPFQWGRSILRLACWKCISLTWGTPWRQHSGTTACEEIIICHKSYFITAFFVWRINSTATQEFRGIIWNHYVQYRITAPYKWSQSWVKWIHSTLLHHVSLRSTKLLPLTHRYSKKTLALHISIQPPHISLRFLTGHMVILLIILDFIALTIFGAAYKWWSSSLLDFL